MINEDNTRSVREVSDPEIGRLAQTCFNRFAKGERYTREMLFIRFCSVLIYAGWKVPLDIPWLSEVYNDERTKDYALKHLSDITDPSIPFSERADYKIHAMLTWTVFQCLKLSDTPSWYNITEDLLFTLLTTELGGVYPEDIQLPFPGFFVELPGDDIYILNKSTGYHPVHSISVCEGVHNRYKEDGSLEESSGRRLLITLWGDASDKSTSVADDHIYYITLPLYADKKVTDLVAQDHLDIWNRDKKAAEQWEGIEFGTIFGHTLTFKEANEVIRRFVVNFLLYISMHPEDVVHANKDRVASIRGSVKKSNKKGKKKKSGKLSYSQKAYIQRLMEEPSWTVGSRIDLDSRFKSAVKKTGVTAKAQRVLLKAKVCGHWKRQVCGPRLPNGDFRDRKLIHVAPYVRNKDAEGSAFGHDYHAK